MAPFFGFVGTSEKQVQACGLARPLCVRSTSVTMTIGQRRMGARVVALWLAAVGCLLASVARAGDTKPQIPPPPPAPPFPVVAGGIVGPLPGHGPMGYRCSTERQLWVQLSPCPPTYVPAPGEAPDDGPQPVRQLPLERQPFCQYLAYGVSVGHGWSADRQASERKRLRTLAVCGG
jgi:hypothetical protein